MSSMSDQTEATGVGEAIGIPTIPLTIICTLNGAKTDGVLVAVMRDDLEALRAETARLRAALQEAEGRASRYEAALSRLVMEWGDALGNMPEMQAALAALRSEAMS